MRKFVLISILSTLSIAVHGQELMRSDDVYIHMKSDAPLEVIEAESSECLGIMEIERSSFLFKVKIRSFEGFNSPLQREHFNENYMESDRFPDALFKGFILSDIGNLDSTWNSIQVKGTLSVHGVDKERVLDIEMRRTADDLIEFRGTFEVRLDDHDISVPRIVYQKIAEVISITVRGSLQ
ncbi:MAG: YceI family protein [Flavobacteriales bacterium]|nr:YceI family protein [Flavobacteriales bacterium]